MSQLEPGETYIYERVDGRTYARRMGSSERILIGEDYMAEVNARRSNIADEWIPIVEAAEHNSALQHALDRAKIIYELTKKQESIFHHPV